MHFQNFLSSNPSSLLFIDPGINTSGAAVYRCEEQGGKVVSNLLHWDGVDVEKEDMGTWDRVLLMMGRLETWANQYDVRGIFIEEPPGTIYQGGRMQKGNINHLIGRAQKVFKTVSVCYGLLGLFHKRASCEVRTFFPNAWEPHFSHRKGLSPKDWSLWHANLVLTNRDIRGVTKPLKTQREENIADAINQGYFLIQKLSSGKIDW